MSYHRLEIKDLTVSYKQVPAVHHVSLELKCGSCIGLLGPNGAGKTSFFKALVGLVPIETGSVRFHGHSGKVTRSEIAYLPQRTSVDWDFPITVRGIVEMGRYQALGWWRKFREADGLAVFLLTYLFSPRYGIVPKLLRPPHLHEASLARWKRQDHT